LAADQESQKSRRDAGATKTMSPVYGGFGSTVDLLEGEKVVPSGRNSAASGGSWRGRGVSSV